MLKLKAIERNISFEKGKEKWAYVLQPELYSRLSEAKTISEAAMRSGISKGTISAAYAAISETIAAWATEGHSVAVPGLGIMRFGVRAQSVEDVNDVSANLITNRRVIFTPSVELKDELKRTAISITCIDRDGNIVKQTGASDGGNVEEEDEQGTTTPDPSPSNPDTGEEDDDGGLAG
ncbi:MAG: DNA-binding protein [Bacteroidaceae bacterium]|nr:DNA-binding protein [Bacteroidaceae bacterium]